MMAQVPPEPLSCATKQENGPRPTGHDPKSSLPASQRPRLGPAPQLSPPLCTDRTWYMPGVPYPYYYGKPEESESEEQVNASTSYRGFDPAMSIPPFVPPMPLLYPPHYTFQPSKKPEEAKENKILWPEGLLQAGQDELKWIRELGLGKVIDATLSNPWANKKAYEVREFRLHDLVVTNEGNRTNRFEEKIESYYSVQGRMEQSLEIPDKPIEACIAAETYRSHNTSYSMKCTTILTRTISFKMATLPCQVGVTDAQSEFEKRLQQLCDQGTGDSKSSCACTACWEFLESLGGATHYVSSITLGAIHYKVKTCSSSTTQMSQESAVKLPRAGALKTSAKVIVGKSRKRSDEETIGQVPEDGVIKVRSPAEAVIRYSFTPLTNLVSNPEVRAHLKRAIQQYCESRSFTKRGPFRIMSAESIRIDGKNSFVYWKVKSGQSNKDATPSKNKYEIGGTVDANEASNFFIRADISDKTGEWFFITTDPKETHTLDPIATPRQSTITDTLSTASVSENPNSAKGEGTQYQTLLSQDIPDVSDLERYVHMHPHPGSLVLEARSIICKKVARFKLVDRLRHTSIPLKTSSWLPQILHGSTCVPGDPYFIQPAFSPKLIVRNRCLALEVQSDVSTHPSRQCRAALTPDTTRDDEPEYKYSFELKNYKREHKRGAHMMLFALVQGKRCGT